MSTSVKFITSDMRGAPTINGTAGTLIAALDAFFTTGWGVTTALSVSVTGGVATATLTPGETFDRDAVVLVAGATPGDLNGEARVLSSSNTSVTWATEAADGAATGTITIRYAPQNLWSKVYAGTNKAVYRSTDVQSAGHYLRVDDTGTTTARIRGYETMTDVDTGTGPFPTDTDMSGGGYWWKSTGANSTAVKWRMFSDGRFLLLSIAAGVQSNSNNVVAPARGFGDPIPLAPGGDAWATLLSVGGSASSPAGTAAFDSTKGSSASGLTCAPRAFTGIGGSVLQQQQAVSGAQDVASGADNIFGSFPSPVDGQLKMSRMFSRQAPALSPPRVIVPGIFYIPQSGVWGPVNDGDKLDGSGELAGRKVLAIGAGTSSFVTPTGIYVVDITGPWR